ncbi:hypothetical protein NDU88_003212 [Pleurodeles waltl]|uniref:Uncharacterized protein n=1 Tax=Pleurodeles waltl TaxID=8319 RepID=A0AAV7QEU5_PLEWA|nr:hypothetical protein NDU88_003212 [Pleurodeles waltl]
MYRALTSPGDSEPSYAAAGSSSHWPKRPPEAILRDTPFSRDTPWSSVSHLFAVIILVYPSAHCVVRDSQ